MTTTIKYTATGVVILILAIGAFFLFKSFLDQDSDVQGEKGEKIENESLSIKGSDTLLQLVSNLVENFNKENAGSDISVAGGGSGTGIAALLNKEIKIANASRAMKEKEWSQAQEFGLDIHEFVIARDGLSVIVNPDNPVSSLTINEVGKLYRGEVANWSDINGHNGQVVLYGRQSTSGTYEFFRETVVQDDYSLEMRNMEGNQAIVEAVKNDKNGIGYVGVGYIVNEDGEANSDIKVLKIASDKESGAIYPLDIEKVKAGQYPLTRPLYQYVVGKLQKDSLLLKFLEFEVSAKGAEVIKKIGFFEIFVGDIEKNNLLFQKVSE